MSFQDEISKIMREVLNRPEYKIPYNKLKERSYIFEQNQKQEEKEGLEI